MRYILLFVLFSGVSFGVWAQTCSQRLNRAEDDFEAGRLLNIPDVITDLLATEDCLNHQEEIRARKLLTKTYIFIDEEAKAEIALIGLLKTDPEHILDKQEDPRELFFLMDQFRTDPIFRIAFRAGANATMINVIQEFNTTSPSVFPKYYNGKKVSGPDTDAEGNKYSSSSGAGVGFNLELMFERHLLYGFEVGLGSQLRWSSYNVDCYLVNSNLVTSLTNDQFYFRTPLLFRYTLGYDNHDKFKIKPYVYGGVSADFLISSGYSEASRRGGTTYTLDQKDDLTETSQVNEFDMSLFAGVGVKWRIATHYLTIEARYDNALNNYIDADDRYNNNSSVFDLGFVEDNLSINALSFSVGWAHSIYSPKKLKDYR